MSPILEAFSVQGAIPCQSIEEEEMGSEIEKKITVLKTHVDYYNTVLADIKADLRQIRTA